MRIAFRILYRVEDSYVAIVSDSQIENFAMDVGAQDFALVADMVCEVKDPHEQVFEFEGDAEDGMEHVLEHAIKKGHLSRFIVMAIQQRASYQ